MKPLAPALILVLGACVAQQPPHPTSASPAVPLPPPTFPPPPPCPVVTSGDWHATIAKAADSAPRQVALTGTVTFPYPGWSPTWPRSMRSPDDPTQLLVELEPHVQEKGQSPTVQHVRADWPASPPVRTVTVTCRNTTLAENLPVGGAP